MVNKVYGLLNTARKYHEEGCMCSYLNPVTEWAGGSYIVIVAYECPYCKKRTPASEFVDKGS